MAVSIEETKDVPWGSIRAAQFRPDGMRFDAPARLSFRISDGSLPKGVKKESLRVAVLESGTWKIIDGSSFDPADGAVSAPIKHFSIYGLVPEPGVVTGEGTSFEVNGISARTRDPVHGRLLVAPSFVSFYAEADAAVTTSLTISGLPVVSEHHVYMGSHDDHYVLTPDEGGEITLPLSLSIPSLVWVQPQPSTIVIGGGPGADDCDVYGVRAGDVCTLTADIVGEIELRGGSLDCDGHSVTQPAAYGGSGIGILVPAGTHGAVIENCTIGSSSGYFGYGVEVLGSDTVVVSNNVLTDNIIGILLQGASNSFVSDNSISGASFWAVALWDSSLGNEVSGNTIDVDYDAITIEGLVSAPSSSDNRVLGNTVTRATGGILLDKTSDNTVKQNTISCVLRALAIGPVGWPNAVYWNNFHDWDRWGVWSDIGPVEISHATYGGNWWGRVCPGPLFVPGVDSNRVDVIDSFPYGEEDAWEKGLHPGCVSTEDRDGDGIPDVTDNCPDVWNPGQENVDGFGEGDACDVTPPDPPVITYPVQGGMYGAQVTVIQGSAELRSRVMVYEGSRAVVDGYADDAGIFTLHPATSFTDGPHSLTAYAQDAAGNLSAPSPYVSFEVSLYPPEPPVIVRPAEGEILGTHLFEISGRSLPGHLVSIFVDDGFAGSELADAFGDFSIVPTTAVPDGVHVLKAHATDDFGRISAFSDEVTISVFAPSAAAPVSGVNGKLSVTGISDSPDPFSPGVDSPALRVNANVRATDGIGGNSPTHTFSSLCRISIKDALTGAAVQTLEESLDITGAPVEGGKVYMDHNLSWDGKDAFGTTVPSGQLYTYDLDLLTLKIHQNPKSKCGREPCVIDEAHLAKAGSISSAAVPRAPHKFLFVSNGQYPQEQAIVDHFQAVNAEGDGVFFVVQVLPDYRITGDIDLDSADAIILTGLAPNVTPAGLLNIKNSEKPVLIVESGKYNYSLYFNLVTNPTSIMLQGDRIEVATHDHPATYYLGDAEKVYSSAQKLYGVPPSYVPEGVTALMRSPSPLGEVVALADSARSIISTGIYDTTHFTTKGWVIFDLFMNFLHPTGKPWDKDPDGAVQALFTSGVMDFLSGVSKNPQNWSYDSALGGVWSKMVREDLLLMLPELDHLIPRILDPAHGWRYIVHRDGWDTDVLATLFYRKIGDVDYQGDCEEWYSQLIDPANHYLPDRVEYNSTQAGGVPLLHFSTDDGIAMFADTIDPSINDGFAINIYNIKIIDIVYGPPPYGYAVLAFSSGTSTLLDRNELYPDLSSPSSPGEFLWYWWGRNNKYLDPPLISKRPFDFENGKRYDINLDMYKFLTDEPQKPKSMDNLICLAKFFNLWVVRSLPHFDYTYDATNMALPLDPDVNFWCHPTGEYRVFDPMASLPTSFMDAVGSADALLPRMQLVEPGNPYLNQYNPIEFWCENNVDKCKYLDLSENSDDFRNFLGVTEEEYVPLEHITPRYRSYVQWGLRSGIGDRGPWQKPHLMAGMDTMVKILIRREGRALPSGFRDAVCRPSGEPYVNVAWLVYTDTSNETHDPEEDPIVISNAHAGILPSDSSPYKDLIVFMPCFKTVAHVRSTDPYHDSSADWLISKLDLLENEGRTYSSIALPTDPDPATWKYSAISIPPNAKGPAKIVWEGKVILKASDREEIQEQKREFPIYIDPIKETMGTAALDNSMPVCWIGATRKYGTGFLNGDDIGTGGNIPRIDFDYYGFEGVRNWLFGSDLGAWVKLETTDGAKLYALFGDTGVDWNWDSIFFDWFHYRGSTLAFFQKSAPGDTTLGYAGTSCPVMLPELLEDGLPWEMVHADGFNVENGIWYGGVTKSISLCQETGSETVAATTAFQTPSQRDAREGEAYIWYANVADWGTQGGFYKGLPSKPQGYYNPLIVTSAYLNSYDKDPPPWYSFIAKWDSTGVDEMGRSVRWDGEWSNVLLSSVMAVDDLSQHIIDPDVGSLEGVKGILVWHINRYRASPIYLSYATEEDVLFPDNYRHFAGFTGMDGSNPSWTYDESDAHPVIWDLVGEFSTVCFPSSECNIHLSAPHAMPYKVLYHITTHGQSGIVMRDAHFPWGPYSDKIPLFDCFAKQRALGSGVTIMFPEEGGSCYGGYTHPDLWNMTSVGGIDSYLIKFNVSMWRPYKVILVQTDWDELHP